MDQLKPMSSTSRSSPSPSLSSSSPPSSPMTPVRNPDLVPKDEPKLNGPKKETSPKARVDGATGSVITPPAVVNIKKGTTATMRLKQDYLRILKDPVPFITAHPLPSNILEWHYVVKGPENSPYEAGVYHGKLSFPSEFPFKPPAIFMITPNGRFKVNTRLCLSISDYHPDTWNPAWSVSTILTGLLSFMLEKNPTMGSIDTSEYEKKMLAKKSWEFNLKNETFKELFPEITNEILEKRKKAVEEEKRRQSVTGKVSELSEAIRSHGIRAAGGNQGNNGDNGTGLFSGFISNVVVVVVFAAFVYTVRYVLLTISQESNGS